MSAKFISLNEHNTLPQRATSASAGYDVSARFNLHDELTFYSPRNSHFVKRTRENEEGNHAIYIAPSERALIPTGISLDLPDDMWCGVYARSGTSLKKGLIITNGVGVIDADYKGEVFVSVTNNSTTTVQIEDGEKIAQLILHRVELFANGVTVDVERGDGGFGSTTKRKRTKKELVAL